MSGQAKTGAITDRAREALESAARTLASMEIIVSGEVHALDLALAHASPKTVGEWSARDKDALRALELRRVTAVSALEHLRAAKELVWRMAATSGQDAVTINDLRGMQ